MSDNVVILDVLTSLPIQPERVLNAALKADLKMVVVVGETQDGDFYFAGSEAGGPENIWMLEKAKYKLIRITEDD